MTVQPENGAPTTSLITWLREQLDNEERQLSELADVHRFPQAVIWKPDTAKGPECLSVETPAGAKAFRRWWDPRGSGGPVEWGWTLADNSRPLFSQDDVRRRLAEVQSKRQILDVHSGYHSCGVIDYDDADPCDTVKLLAAPYAGLPGWREEWR